MWAGRLLRQCLQIFLSLRHRTDKLQEQRTSERLSSQPHHVSCIDRQWLGPWGTAIQVRSSRTLNSSEDSSEPSEAWCWITHIWGDAGPTALPKERAEASTVTSVPQDNVLLHIFPAYSFWPTTQHGLGKERSTLSTERSGRTWLIDSRGLQPGQAYGWP